MACEVVWKTSGNKSINEDFKEMETRQKINKENFVFLEMSQNNK